MNSISFDQKLYDAAIVELDGIMVDTIGDFVAALNAMLGEQGLWA